MIIKQQQSLLSPQMCCPMSCAFEDDYTAYIVD
uniref:Uncharacterized protein n=1 Tax=Rhizophora mucronata TaxID=61149 RepID=A0A2P2PJP2_RHIMU